MPREKIPSLTVAHNIFLTRDQRYQLATEPNTIIKVIGHSVPVWIFTMKTSEPAEEIFCNYAITNIKDDNVVETLNDGYVVHINSEKDLKMLLDFKDRGNGSVLMTYHTKMNIKNKQISSVHFVSINDWDILIQSLTLS